MVSGVVTGAITVATAGTMTAAGLAAGAALGGAIKAGIKTVDRATNEVDNDALDAKQIFKDGLTGAVDGVLNVATAGMIKGAAAGKTIGQAVKQGMITGAKAGAISGAGAGAASYTAEALTEEDVDFTIKGFLSSTAQNAIGGAVMGGAMGGISQGFAQNKIAKTTDIGSGAGQKPVVDENGAGVNKPEVETDTVQGSKKRIETGTIDGETTHIETEEKLIACEETALTEEIKSDTATPVKKVSAQKKTMPQAPDDYSDTKAFCEYFEDKMKVQLSAKSEEDINKMIREIAQNTGVTEYEAAETLAELTQFTSYKELPQLAQEVKSLGVSSIYDCDGDGTSLNKVMRYVIEKKEQGTLSSLTLDNTQGLFLDESAIKWMSQLDDTAKQQLTDSIKAGQVKLISVDGWNISSGVDDSYLSYGMFGQSEDLESLATRVINQAKNEGTDITTYLDNINQSMETKAKSILGDDISISTVRNYDAMNNFYMDGTGKSISETMTPKMPTQDELETAIDTIIEKKLPNKSANEIKEARKLLAQYYDEMYVGFSSENLTEEMVAKYAAIQTEVEAMGKTMDDVVYLIPTAGKNSIKSFDLLLYQYQQANGILDSDQIVRYCSTNGAPKIPDGKVAVVLDDIVGSGATMTYQEFNYNNFKSVNQNTNVIFTPLCSLEVGIDEIQKTAGLSDVIIDCKIVDFEKQVNSTLTRSEQNTLYKLLGCSGVGSGYACTAMPYMMPDNNSDASSAFLQLFLNSSKGNKNKNEELTRAVYEKYIAKGLISSNSW